LIIVPTTPGHFFQPGKNSLRLNSLPGFQIRRGVACSLHGVCRKDDQGQKTLANISSDL
jgi:hypothetical protein